MGHRHRHCGLRRNGGYVLDGYVLDGYVLDGYVLDGYGGMHPFGDAPAVSSSAYWPGWNIAGAIITTHDGIGAGGYVLDGYGGIHPLATLPLLPSPAGRV